MDLSSFLKKATFLLCCFFTLTLSGHSSTPLGLAAKASQQDPSLQKKGLVVLDAGHGGHDEGAKVHSLQEKKIALLTTLYAKRYLEEMGYRVLLTRSRDVYVPLPKRVLIANKAKSALFVSIHYNSAPNPAAQGLEAYYYKGGNSDREKASRKLAHLLLYGVMNQTGTVSRGIKAGNHLHVIRETAMPSVLFEAGFMTNDEERMNMRKKPYLEKIAKGIAQGIDRFLRS